MLTLIILGIFTGLKAKIGTGILTAVLGFGFIKNWAKIVDFVAKKTESISGKLKTLFGHIEETASDVDDSIDDTTGKISLDKKDEIIQDVKDVIDSAKEVGNEFKPKK